MTKVIWTDYAKESLQEIVDFLENRWGNELKEEVIQFIDKRINPSRINPDIAPYHHNTIFKKLFIRKNLIIFYTLTPDAIQIVLSWDRLKYHLS